MVCLNVYRAHAYTYTRGIKDTLKLNAKSMYSETLYFFIRMASEPKPEVSISSSSYNYVPAFVNTLYL